jgi:hypothetical protein
VEKLEDQKVLKKIAKNDKDEDVRKKAVEKLEDQEALAWVAKNDKDEYVRKAAMEKLDKKKYHNLIENLAKNSEEKDSKWKKDEHHRTKSLYIKTVCELMKIVFEEVLSIAPILTMNQINKYYKRDWQNINKLFSGLLKEARFLIEPYCEYLSEQAKFSTFEVVKSSKVTKIMAVYSDHATLVDIWCAKGKYYFTGFKSFPKAGFPYRNCRKQKDKSEPELHRPPATSSISGERSPAKIPDVEQRIFEKRFDEWDLKSVREIEQLCLNLPVLPRSKAMTFFKKAGSLTKKDIKVIERQSGKVFESLAGIVYASDRHEFAVTYNLTMQNPAHRILLLETYDDVIGTLFCVARVSDTSFLTHGFTQSEKSTIRNLWKKGTGTIGFFKSFLGSIKKTPF